MKEVFANLHIRSVLSLFSILLITAICWHFLPSAEAQEKDGKPKPRAGGHKMVGTPGDEGSTIRLNAVTINARSAEARSLRKRVPEHGGKRMHLFKFPEPIQGDWYDALTRDGLEVINYIPNYAYLVYGTGDSIRRKQDDAAGGRLPVEWDGEYLPEYRLQPGLFDGDPNDAGSNLATDRILIQLYRDEAANRETFTFVGSIQKGKMVNRWEIGHYVNFIAVLDKQGVRALAERPDVISIAPWIEPEKNDERQNIIMAGQLSGNVPIPGNWLTYLAGRGFTQAQFDASGFVVNVSDDGLDAGSGSPLPGLTQYNLLREGVFSGGSRIVYNRPYGTATQLDTQGCDGHGNINTSIVAGYVPNGAPYNASPHADASGYRYGMGIAPFVLVGSSTIFSNSGGFTNPNIPVLESDAYTSGARISTNSWGAAVGGAYNATSQTYDIITRDAQSGTAGNQQHVLLIAAGNSGPGANTTGAPGTAKNAITVGASENVHPFGGNDGCLIGDTGADSANDIIGFSSRGPTDDLRNKPEVVAPGTHVTGSLQQNSAVASTPVTGTGTAAGCWHGGGVCGGVGSTFFPSGQQFYTASSGTSHSTPAVAGFAALIRQHFINQLLTPPSPAMTKAAMMNTARYMNGVGANDNLWSNNQGMGMVDMDNYFDRLFGGPRIVRDQVGGDMFTASGQQRVFTGTIADNTRPFRVTVAWSDKEGSTTSGALVNNLDLEVSVDGTLYRGNVFSGANSAVGGSADIRNNAESVFVPAGVSGPVAIKVKATNIAGDGVPGNASPLDQDFALVVQNLTESPLAVLQNNGVAYVTDNHNDNDVPEPGETVTVSLTLENIGTADSGPNVTATLQNSGGISHPSGPQNYGTLTAGGGPVSRDFIFYVPLGTPCGSQITLTFDVQDGLSTTTVEQSFTVGLLQTYENTAPITIPSSGNATPYPSTINVSGVSGNVTTVNVEVFGFTHTWPDDVDIVLVAPGGQAFAFMSDLGGGNSVTNVNLMFDDSAATLPPAILTTGTFRPSNISTGDSFPAPGPGVTFQNPAPAGTATFTSTFGGIAPNGSWNLFALDDLGGFAGSIAGWRLTINPGTYVCLGPTAAAVTVSGQVTLNGFRRFSRVRIVLEDLKTGATVYTVPGPFGFYSFENVELGTYQVRAEGDGIQFEPQNYVVTLVDDLHGLDFTGTGPP